MNTSIEHYCVYCFFFAFRQKIMTPGYLDFTSLIVILKMGFLSQ